MAEARIFLHPLVIMTIADHHARYVAENKKYDLKNPPRVMGAVFGYQTDKSVEILSSVELPFRLDEEKQIRIDDESFAEDVDLYKQIYPEHEILGWYATSTDVKDVDLPFHKRFTEYNESPLYLRMNPVPRRTDKALPVTLYRTEMKTVGDKLENVFVEIPYKVVSEPSERLTTDHVIRNKDVPTRGSQIVPQFEEVRNAVEALQNRIKLLVEYLDRVEQKKIKPNRAILKSIQSISNRLPTTVAVKFEEDFFTEMSNGMMMTYLAAMTKAAAKVNDSLDLHDLVSDGGRGRGRGLRRFAA